MGPFAADGSSEYYRFGNLGKESIALNLTDPGEGLNAATGNYENLFDSGVIDAAKVTRSALQNAASIAALFLTTEALVVDKPEPQSPPASLATRSSLLWPAAKPSSSWFTLSVI